MQYHKIRSPSFGETSLPGSFCHAPEGFYSENVEWMGPWCSATISIGSLLILIVAQHPPRNATRRPLTAADGTRPRGEGSRGYTTRGWDPLAVTQGRGARPCAVRWTRRAYRPRPGRSFFDGLDRMLRAGGLNHERFLASIASATLNTARPRPQPCCFSMSSAAARPFGVAGHSRAAACPFLDHAACTPGDNEGVLGLVERHAHSTVQPGCLSSHHEFSGPYPTEQCVSPAPQRPQFRRIQDVVPAAQQRRAILLTARQDMSHSRHYGKFSEVFVKLPC